MADFDFSGGDQKKSKLSKDSKHEQPSPLYPPQLGYHSSGPPPPAYDAVQPAHISSVLVNYTNAMWTKATVTHGDMGPPLYNIDYKLKKPHLRLYRNGVNTPCGSATFHLHTQRIDIMCNGRTFDLRPKKWYKIGFKYVSPTTGGPVTWSSRSGWKNFDYTLADDGGRVLAKFTSAGYLHCKKIGRIDFMPGVASNQAAMDEIIITVQAIAYYVQIYTMGAMS